MGVEEDDTIRIGEYHLTMCSGQSGARMLFEANREKIDIREQSPLVSLCGRRSFSELLVRLLAEYTRLVPNQLHRHAVRALLRPAASVWGWRRFFRCWMEELAVVRRAMPAKPLWRNTRRRRNTVSQRCSAGCIRQKAGSAYLRALSWRGTHRRGRPDGINESAAVFQELVLKNTLRFLCAINC